MHQDQQQLLLSRALRQPCPGAVALGCAQLPLRQAAAREQVRIHVGCNLGHSCLARRRPSGCCLHPSVTAQVRCNSRQTEWHLCICCHVSAKDQQYVSRTGWARCDQTCDLVLAHQRSTVKSMLTGCAASGDQAVATGSGSLTGAVAMWSHAQVWSHSEGRFLGQH